MLPGEKNTDSHFRCLVLTGEKVTSQTCFISIIDLLFSVTSGSSTPSLVLVLFIRDAEEV